MPSEREIDVDAVRLLLRESVRKAGTAQAWGAVHGLSRAYVSEVVTGRRPPSATVLAALGLEPAGRRYRVVGGAL